MAIDTNQKKLSAIANAKRLPWFRRFSIPLPDGSNTITQEDRQQVNYIYVGILTTELTPSAGGGRSMLLGVG